MSDEQSQVAAEGAQQVDQVELQEQQDQRERSQPAILLPSTSLTLPIVIVATPRFSSSSILPRLLHLLSVCAQLLRILPPPASWSPSSSPPSPSSSSPPPPPPTRPRTVSSSFPSLSPSPTLSTTSATSSLMLPKGSGSAPFPLRLTTPRRRAMLRSRREKRSSTASGRSFSRLRGRLRAVRSRI